MFQNRRIMNTGTLLASLILSLSHLANAEGSDSAASSSTKAESASGANKVPGAEDVDDILTNNNLRALSGSKSRWSFAGNVNYSGGTISAPFQEDRPNISAGSGITRKNDFDGTLNIKFNMDSVDALLLGFGARWIAPFDSKGPGGQAGTQPYGGKSVDAYNPSLTYQRIYKLGEIQEVLQVALTQWTQSDYTLYGYAQQISVDQENVYEVPGTHLSVGFSLGAGYNTFTSDDVGIYGDPNNGPIQSVSQVWLVPYTEYALTEKVNLRALVNPWSFEHYRLEPNTLAFVRDNIYASMGVGISVTRDIFVYPNVQFLPDRIKGDMTNVAVNGTINLF